MSELNTNNTSYQEVPSSEEKFWKCDKCGTLNTAKYCTTCGAEHTIKKVEAPVKQKKKRNTNRSHPFLTAILCAVIGAGAGFGGGMLAANQFSSSNTVVYQQVQSSGTSTTANVSTSTSSLTVGQVAAIASPSVVEITTEITATSYGMFGGTYTSQAAGSGVIITEDGYIITNNHVVEDATAIYVTTNDGTQYTATLIGADSKSDIAVIKVDATNLTAATIGDSSTIAVGDTAIVIGNPLGTLGGTVTDGIISATDRQITINNESMNLIQTNAAINSGNSGGGLFDGNGNLIGIVNAKDSGFTSSGTTIEGLGFAIPINDAMDVATQLIESGYVTNRATIGISLQTLTQSYGQYPAGLYIADIYTGSGAEAAGLQVGDRLIAADGTEISSYTELSKILRTKEVGDILTLTIVRNNETYDVDVTLTSPLETTLQG